jgi:ABC-2 type transport system ATP-binding protein
MKLFEAKNVSKNIDGTMVLSDISITISQGERIAITGSNGSGKSSLLKFIGGIYVETDGEVQREKLKIGYVPEHFPENIRFKIKDYLLLVGNMGANSDDNTHKKIEYYTEVFAIKDFLNTPIKKCSKGTKQKVGIIQALIMQPDLLLLDEPLTGLDDKAQMELFHQLQSLSEEITILFTVHDQLLIERIANRVIVVEGGKIISDTAKGEKEITRIIKAIIPKSGLVSEFPNHKLAGKNTIEIVVPARESDQVLAKLLELGCSIIELREKR